MAHGLQGYGPSVNATTPRIVLSFGRNKKVSPMTLFALLIWRCWVYTAWKCLPCFRRAPRVRSATHVQLTSLAVDPFRWLGHTASSRPIVSIYSRWQ